MSGWTEEKTQRLIKMWDAGSSFTDIGAAIGMTRNAVCGKIDRLRKGGHVFKRPSLTKAFIVGQAAAARAQRARQPKTRREAGQEAAETQRLYAALKRAKRAKAKPKPKPVESAPVLVDASFARPWLERGVNQCAFPIAGEGMETISCCAPTWGKRYCAGHTAIMFKPPECVGEKYVKRTARIAA